MHIECIFRKTIANDCNSIYWICPGNLGKMQTLSIHLARNHHPYSNSIVPGGLLVKS